MSAITRSARAALNRLGLDIRRVSRDGDEEFPPDFDAAVRELYRKVRPYTLTSPERVLALRDAVRYICQAGIPGDICECGVWRGGSMLVITSTLVEMGDTSRDLYLFDTFTRPPDTGPRDGEGAQQGLEAALKSDVFSYLPMEEVRRNLEATGYPGEKIHFVVGLVEDTIPEQTPDVLALARLDTDYYASTAHELTHLYPRISQGGIMIIDDYGEFQGAHDAVEDWLGQTGESVLMNRIDNAGRLIVVANRGATP